METIKSITFSLHGKMVLSVLFLFIAALASGQKSDTSYYLPQINLSATNGFGPYIIGTEQENTILASALPAHTSKVMFRFIDADSIQVGSAYVVVGNSLNSVSWNMQLDTFNLPLSPQLHLELTYSSDSTADYYVPYTVYPDTVSFYASKGWGPFITNNYPLSDTSWHPVPQLSNTFVVKTLPPRSDTVIFQILAADSTVIRSLTVHAAPGSWLDSAAYPNVRIDNLPLNTSYLRVLIHGNGAPSKGLEFHKSLLTTLQKPRLISKSQGVTQVDSIPVFIQNPVQGQALMVDSVKHAVITNGPGLPFFEWFRGPYSFDVINDDFTIEAWLRLDLENITHNTNKEDYFIQIDSAYSISFVSEGNGTCDFRLYAIVSGDFYQLYEANFPISVLQGQEWHHFAFTLEAVTYNIRKFYLDGYPLNTTVGWDNITYIQQNYPDYDRDLQTRPLYLGGLTSDEPSYITAFDEVRFWLEWRTQENILKNMHQKVLQEYFLAGYWDFDDQRNRLNFVSDDSYFNNSGSLVNNAAFIPENPDLFNVPDTLILSTSNANTDSVKCSFVNEDNSVLDSVKLKVNSGKVQWVFDISELPYTVTHLKTGEICTGSPPGGFETDFTTKILPPVPIATPQCNWGVYYDSINNFGTITNPIVVNGFPSNTTMVELGLKKENNYFNADQYTINSVPYQYSLNLNGTDNYIQTSQQMAAPNVFELSLWFKTTTTKWGVIIGFYDNPQGMFGQLNDRQIIMNTDGSIMYWCISFPNNVALYAANKYNDGLWHCVTVKMDVPDSCYLYMDGSLVDKTGITSPKNYDGYWVIGRYNDGAGSDNYFEGSLAYVNIMTTSDASTSPVDYALLNGAHRGNMLYKMDEGLGTQIHDTQGSNNGTLMGSTQSWAKTNKLSTIRWEHNMLNLYPGTYTFYSKVYYPGGGEQGVYYPLGNYNIQNPLPGYSFAYNFSNGIGYFNEGVSLSNLFSFKTNYTGQGNAGWQMNCIRYYLMSPAHQIIDHNIFKWTATGVNGSMNIDMGPAVPGSYINFQIGYLIPGDTIIESYFSIPFLIRPLLAPTIRGDFGPFEQAIAPGTMQSNKTFTVLTEGLTDITQVTAGFYDVSGNEIATVNGVNAGNSSWNITQNMAVLSPPESFMKISYFLGANKILVLVAGPYKITIHKTRPDWFDMIPDTYFSNIQESGDNVTFQINTPFDNSYLINNSSEMDIPAWVPLIGGSNCEMDMPTGQAYLKYIKSQSQLVLNEPPVFFQKVFNLGAGQPTALSFGFNYSQNNSFELDDKDNLIASQNFSVGGSLTSGFQKFANIVTKIQEIIRAAEVADPETIIVSPSFELTYTGSFEYSSRAHLMIDTVTGKWGSFGNLNIDANPSHTDAFNKSTSYNFYSGALGMEFAVGAELLEGLLSGHFGLDGRFLLGFGQSYVTIPGYQSKPLKSFAFQTYGRFYIDILWGWYEKTLWGPKLFYSTTIWGDDMTNAFPPAGKKKAGVEPIPAHSSWPALADTVRPVSSFSRIPVSLPQATVHSTDNHVLFNWLEKGDAFGERKLRQRYLDPSTHRFSIKRTIEINHHALNSPVSDALGDSLVILAWAQSRHTEDSFSLTGTSDPMKEFIRSQDIWFAVYDLAKDTLLQMNRLEDDITTYTSGRAEANPKITLLSPSLAIVTWQVVNLEMHQADIWYTRLEKHGTQWTQTSPAIAVSGSDVKTQIKINAAGEGRAVMVWLSTSGNNTHYSTIKSSVYNGTTWSAPDLISGADEYFCNYLDLSFRGDKGGLVYTKFVEDTVNGHHEKLVLLPWSSDHWNKAQVVELLVDSINHLQLPRLAIFKNGFAAVAIKREKMTVKSEHRMISEIDIFKGDLNQPSGIWHNAGANPFICDTNRQVSELNLAFINKDSLLLLSQEYPMLAVNAASKPRNGVVFGDPYMNQVLRCFSMREDGYVADVDENNYFLGVPEPGSYPDNTSNLQCYPNPCADHTTVSFNITGPSQVTMELFTIQGNRVATLIHQDLNTGLYEIDLNTSLLQSGTFICRLLTGDTVHSLKLIVSK